MKSFQTTILFFASSALVSAISIQKRGVDPGLIPDFGHQAGLNPTGTGDCDGIASPVTGQAIKVPCACPPPRDAFIASLNANVDAGRAVNNPSVTLSFPTGNDKNSRSARMIAALITLQNLNGPGKGCPASSTTFSAQLAAIQNSPDVPSPGPAPAPAAPPAPAPPAPAPPAPAPPAPATPAPAALNLNIDPTLVPDFGHQAGLNPTGTGDCDGVTNPTTGLAIKVPCACPPDRNEFIQSLNANVQAGHVVNNPTVLVSFPTGNDKASKLARIQASLTALQNLHGPGQGCPASSTTFVAQQKAIANSP